MVIFKQNNKAIIIIKKILKNAIKFSILIKIVFSKTNKQTELKKLIKRSKRNYRSDQI